MSFAEKRFDTYLFFNENYCLHLDTKWNEKFIGFTKLSDFMPVYTVSSRSFPQIT